MGSEISSNTNQSVDMKLAGLDQMSQTSSNMEQTWSRPTRSTLYAEDFYCPFVVVHGNEKYKATPNFKQEQILDAETLSMVLEERKYCNLKKQIGCDAKDEHSDENRRNLDYLCYPTDPKVSTSKMEEEIANIAVESELKGIKVNFCNLDPIILNPILTNGVETKDMCTGTSQPTYIETAAGNSQPYFMKECATGMTQLSGVADTVECGTQTSQELPFSCNQQSISGKNDSVIVQQQKCLINTNKSLIVFPRVSCQTTAPQIPAKIPRLDDLDQSIIMNPIYSSDVTFDFREADKENDVSVLRQRGNVGKRMTDCSILKSNDENYSINKLTPKLTSSSSNELVASRGPFLRVGLSKKSRTRKPLHPRIFETEQNNRD